MNYLTFLGLWLLLAGAAQAQTILQLTQVPPHTPVSATLYLAGSCNAWQPADKAYAFTRAANGKYQCTLPSALRGDIEFKITRGSWSAVEANAEKQDIANRHLRIGSGPTIVELQVSGWKDDGPEGDQKPCISTALKPNVQILATDFYIPQLKRRRRVWIYLPNGYAADSAKRYPVLYMHDGQNLFDACTGFSGEWGVDETLSQLQQQGLDATGCLVVAVDNGGSERLNELSPWRNPEYGGGQGEQYVDFLVHTLKPYIDAHYRTLTGREFTGIAGSSMGGLISTYAALQYPQVYSKVGVFSPAFWFAKDSLFQYVDQHPANPATRFYFVSGTTESETMAPLMQKIYQVIEGQGVPAQNLTYVAQADGKHAEWFWKREFAAAYQMLYKKDQASPLACSVYSGLTPSELHVELPAGVRAVKLQVVGADGRAVLRKKVKAGSDVSVGQLSKGQYTLRTSVGKQSSTQVYFKD